MGKLPCRAVSGGVDLDGTWGENPVVGIVEETHGDGLHSSDAAKVQFHVDILSPIALPVAVVVGVVAAQHSIGQSVVTAAAVLGFIVIVEIVEFLQFADGLVEKEVLLAVDGFVPLAEGDRANQTAAPNGEGALVKVGTLRGFAPVDSEVNGAVLEKGAQGDVHLAVAIVVGDENALAKFLHLASQTVKTLADNVAAVVRVLLIPKAQVFQFQTVQVEEVAAAGSLNVGLY